MTVDLESVPEPRLHDAVATLDRAEQAVDVGDQIVVDAVQVLGHDRAEQQPAETGRRVDWQHEMAECETPRGLGRPRVPDLDLCQQHGAQT